MKRTFLLALAAIALFMQSCGSGTEGETTAVDSTAQALPAVLARGTVELNLSEQFFPFTMLVPDSSRGLVEVEETGYGETIVRVGTVFNMSIAEGGDMSTKKAEVADDLMFTNTIVEEGDDFIVYKSVIEGSPLDPEYHFYAVKDVNGMTYEFKDNKDEGPFAESIVRLMIESVNHIAPNSPAS
ncbi:MAG: hypothetical protein HQ500_04030 [Flavobacteriales bacterium]|nr:hypothetical protein [Flavobacteriales bacterium]